MLVVAYDDFCVRSENKEYTIMVYAWEEDEWRSKIHASQLDALLETLMIATVRNVALACLWFFLSTDKISLIKADMCVCIKPLKKYSYLKIALHSDVDLKYRNVLQFTIGS